MLMELLRQLLIDVAACERDVQNEGKFKKKKKRKKEFSNVMRC